MSTIFHSSTKHAQLKTKRKKKRNRSILLARTPFCFSKIVCTERQWVNYRLRLPFSGRFVSFCKRKPFLFRVPNLLFSVLPSPKSPPLINTIKISPERINRPQFRKNFILTLIAWQRQNKRQERESLQMASARGHTGLLR